MTLGCSTNIAYITDRGGKVVLGLLEPTSLVRWGRIRDGISAATVTVASPSVACCAVLSKMRCGRHEMVIYRDGKRVWEGPLTRVSYHGTFVQVDAEDVMHYAFRTICHAGYNNNYPNTTPVTERMRTIMLAEMARKEALDPPIDVLPYLQIDTDVETAHTSRITLPYQTTVWEDVDALAAKSGLDYSVIGRRIFANGTHDIIGRTPVATEADFLGDVVVTEYGVDLVTYSAVTDGLGHWGAVGAIHPYYGEWEILNTAFQETENVSATVTPTTAALRSQARRNSAGRLPPPLVVRVPDSSTVHPETSVFTMENLVPGIRVPLMATATCRTIRQEQKLDSMRVEETDSGETIAVTLSPAPGALPEDWVESGSDG